MTDNEFSVESPENYEPKSICCLVLDLSWSMHGKPIEELNHGLQEFHADIAAFSVYDPTASTYINPKLLKWVREKVLLLEN